MSDDDGANIMLEVAREAKRLKLLTEALMSVIDVSSLDIEQKTKALCISLGTILNVQIKEDMIKKGHEHAYVQGVLRLVREIAEGSYHQ